MTNPVLAQLFLQPPQQFAQPPPACMPYAHPFYQAQVPHASPAPVNAPPFPAVHVLLHPIIQLLYMSFVSTMTSLLKMKLLEFEDCGEHCHSWEFLHLGLDSGFCFVLEFFTCLQGAVLHWPNSNFIGVIYLGLLYRKIQQKLNS